MKQEALAVIVLAAGLGKRMGSSFPKVLHPLCGKTLIEHVLLTVSLLKPSKCVVVTGHGKHLVEETLKNSPVSENFASGELLFAEQTSQQGTGDAVKAALPKLEDFKGTVLILYGDVPLLKAETLERLIEKRRISKSDLSILTALYPLNVPYGRILRDKTSQEIEKIVEAKDCTPSELLIGEMNCGLYAIASENLASAIHSLNNDNAQHEYYLTDIVEGAVNKGLKVSSLTLTTTEELQGVNTQEELSIVAGYLLRQRVYALMAAGVNVQDPDTVYLDENVTIGEGSEIGPNVYIFGKSDIGKNVTIEGSAYIKDTHIADNARIKFSVRMESSIIGEAASVGPFAHLRPKTVLQRGCRIGNFVETKNAYLEEDAKASHLTYLGDCTVGKDANIGAGTITCNYDGAQKHKTEIGEGAFIGSNSALVAPVKIGKNSIIGAGSVITKDVPDKALGITRSQQINRENYRK